MRQGTNGVSIYFKNDDSGEYLWYKIKLEVDSPQVLSEHTLSCPVREEAETRIGIANPLSIDVPISLKCDDAQVSMITKIPNHERAVLTIYVFAVFFSFLSSSILPRFVSRKRASSRQLALHRLKSCTFLLSFFEER